MSVNAEYMQMAIRLARKGRYTTHPNPNVGCVIVAGGVVVGQGWHRCAGEPHAEINALDQAGEKAKGATVFVTLEPCSHTGKTPPCADALIKAGVKKVIAAMQDPNPLVSGEGLRRLSQAGIETECGLLEAQARELNQGFIKRMESGRPFVRVKLAMSLDGRTAMASGESKWISSEASRRDVQRLRAESSAILTGIGTVLADDPSMNLRLSAMDLDIDPDGPVLKQPVRIVVDTRFRMPEHSRIAGLPGECIVYTAKDVENAERYPFKIVRCTERDGHIDLHALVRDLADSEINLLHVEAGPVLCGALLKNDLVDEIIIYMAPHIMGDNARGLFHLPGLEAMEDRIGLQVQDVRSIGDDIRLTVRPTA